MNSTTSVYAPISHARTAGLSLLATKFGARTHVIRRIHVDQGRDWNEAINLIGPDTQGTSFVRKPNIGEQYLPVSSQEDEFDVILFSYLGDRSSGEKLDDRMSSWVQEANVINTNPREVFAIGQRYRNFNTSVYRQAMSINCPSYCSFIGQRHLCFLSYTRSHFSERIAHRSIGLRIRDFLANEDDWFAFREPRPELVR